MQADGQEQEPGGHAHTHPHTETNGGQRGNRGVGSETGKVRGREGGATSGRVHTYRT